MAEEMITFNIPDWDTFINGPVTTEEKLMLIMAMSMLSDLMPDADDTEVWHSLRMMAKNTVETLNNAE